MATINTRALLLFCLMVTACSCRQAPIVESEPGTFGLAGCIETGAVLYAQAQNGARATVAITVARPVDGSSSVLVFQNGTLVLDPSGLVRSGDLTVTSNDGKVCPQGVPEGDKCVSSWAFSGDCIPLHGVKK